VKRFPDAGKTFTEEEKAERTRRGRAEQDRNIKVYVSGWRCHCGSQDRFKAEWLAASDSLQVTCSKGHVSAVRFIPESM
jgi:hypothetical protein